MLIIILIIKPNSNLNRKQINISMKRLLIILITIYFSNVSAEEFEGRVIRVTDGDTIAVLMASNQTVKIRLAGIDAPEKKQAFGNRSKQSLSDLVYGKQVTIIWNKTDRYGRTVGKVLFDKVDVNNQQLTKGYAWFYKKYENELSLEDRKLYQESESKAKNSKLGLWYDTNPIEPWLFRKMR